MTVLLIRMAGPMQSWGTQSRFVNRDAGREPSKSGVIGLLCAALGISRDDLPSIASLALLKMGVRVDREGNVMRDFHTIGGGRWPGKAKYGVYKASGQSGGTVISDRYYLADADFLVALQGDQDLLGKLHRALAHPVWLLYLGRKSFVPGTPVWMPDGLKEGEIGSVLRSYPWYKRENEEPVNRLRLVVECGSEDGQARLDVPISFSCTDRRFYMRYVRYEWIPTSILPEITEGSQCIFQG